VLCRNMAFRLHRPSLCDMPLSRSSRARTHTRLIPLSKRFHTGAILEALDSLLCPTAVCLICVKKPRQLHFASPTSQQRGPEGRLLMKKIARRHNRAAPHSPDLQVTTYQHHHRASCHWQNRLLAPVVLTIHALTPMLTATC
jgi:hypothetical protein